jgi:hypothetical protein
MGRLERRDFPAICRSREGGERWQKNLCDQIIMRGDVPAVCLRLTCLPVKTHHQQFYQRKKVGLKPGQKPVHRQAFRSNGSRGSKKGSTKPALKVHRLTGRREA